MQTIDRAAAVLRALSGADSHGIRLSDVAEATELGKSTVLRLLGALGAVGYVEYDGDAKRYRLGYGLFELGMSARRFHLLDQARTVLDRLAAATGDTVFLSVRDSDQALCADRRTGSYPIRSLTLSVGDRRPLGVGAGSLALLAFERDEEINRVLESSKPERKCFERFGDAALRAMIAATRRDGYSFNDGHIVNAMNAVGVPVLDDSGRVIAALSIAAIRDRMQDPRRAKLVALLHAESRALGRRNTERTTGADG
ncbi:IclR family transcriptional regulator [Sedimentitalea todarodis]|uniref:IclR family transcriptional regulator n=1 Tax=Sedimentitalea todarodis TaxID=1631240 RepID=A0ABU3VIW6_9RHOB|nr:IclR family transcriptional regulator [Sedimentitalea todarodis]MDU9005950.1 IclR family transcriptional regulator [Sedimentitalea todarodis]